MAETWDPEMLERFETLETKVDAFSGRFDVVDQRFDAVDRRFDAVDQRFDGVDRRFDKVDARLDAMDRRFDGVDQRLDTVDQRMGAMEERLSHKIDVQMEEVRDLVKKSVEGYGATLEAVVRGLKDFRSEWRTKAEDTDRVLVEHERRITALEQRRRR